MTGDLFAIAQERAKAKAEHARPAGDLDVQAKAGYWWTNAGPGDCHGQLRTAYMRQSVDGRPTWTPVGIVCEACRAFWPGDAK